MPATTSDPKAIFFAALDCGSDTALSAHLDNACHGDPDLRHRVDQLLLAHRKAGNFLGGNQSLTETDHETPAPLGASIGPYKLLEQIGEGGMGVVYVAEQTQPVRRRVALKIIKPGMDTKQVIARFEAERQALAMMDHPNIAKILDAGTVGPVCRTGPDAAEDPEVSPPTPTAGRPYFVMELVRGVPITDFCDQRGLNIPARLELFIQVCLAVQHAHQKGIIHRDLKPTNILVTLTDTTPVPKIIDFGIAKALDGTLARSASEGYSLHTGFAQLIGTPLYMSPEQAEMNPLGVDTRSDVYSLGVLLYELLTGTTPFDKAALENAGFDELRRLIREQDPETVSARIARTRRGAGVSPANRLIGISPDPNPSSDTAAHSSADTHSPSLATNEKPSRLLFLQHSSFRIPAFQEIDWIVAKSLEKDRNRRYESVSALAADVRRYLANEPIAARPASRSYRFRKWLIRNPGTAFFAVIGALVISAALFGGWYHDHHLALANSALDAVNHHLNSANAKLNEALADARRLESEAIDRERQVRQQTYARDLRFAFNAYRFEDLKQTLRYLDRYQTDEQQPDLRGFEWHWLQGLFPAAKRTLTGHSAPLMAADVSPDERWIASGDKAGNIKIRDLASDREVKTLRYADAEITSVAFSPDGQTLATAGVDRTIRLFRVADWSEQATLRGHELTVASIAWSPDGQQLVSGGRDHTLRIWNVASPDKPRTLPGFKDVVRCVAWSPSGETLAAAVRHDGLYLLDTKTWKPRLIQSDDGDHGALALAFDRGGTLLASAGYGSRLYLHDVASRSRLADVATLSSIHALAFSADQLQLFAGLETGELFVCDLHYHRQGIDFARSFQLGEEALSAVKAPRSGQWLVTAHEQSSTVQTRLISQIHAPREVHRYGSMFMAISAHEDLVCTLDPTGAPQLVSFPPGKIFGPLERARKGRIRSAKFFPVGERLLILDGDALRLYDTCTRQHLGDFEPSGDEPYYLTVSPQGRYVAATVLQAGRWRLCVWEASTRRRVCYLPVPQSGSALRLSFSPNEQILAVASPIRDGGSVLLWNLPTQTKLAEISESAIADLDFSPDGKLLALARNREVLLWNTADHSLTTLPGHGDAISSLAFCPTGGTLASIDNSGTARLWHVPTRQEIGILNRQAIPASNLVFRSPYQLINYPDTQPTKPAAPCDIIVFAAVGRDGSDAGRATAQHEPTTR